MQNQLIPAGGVVDDRVENLNYRLARLNMIKCKEVCSDYNVVAKAFTNILWLFWTLTSQPSTINNQLVGFVERQVQQWFVLVTDRSSTSVDITDPHNECLLKLIFVLFLLNVEVPVALQFPIKILKSHHVVKAIVNALSPTPPKKFKDVFGIHPVEPNLRLTLTNVVQDVRNLKVVTGVLVERYGPIVNIDGEEGFEETICVCCKPSLWFLPIYLAEDLHRALYWMFCRFVAFGDWEILHGNFVVAAHFCQSMKWTNAQKHFDKQATALERDRVRHNQHKSFPANPHFGRLRTMVWFMLFVAALSCLAYPQNVIVRPAHITIAGAIKDNVHLAVSSGFGHVLKMLEIDTVKIIDPPTTEPKAEPTFKPASDEQEEDVTDFIKLMDIACKRVQNRVKSFVPGETYVDVSHAARYAKKWSANIANSHLVSSMATSAGLGGNFYCQNMILDGSKIICDNSKVSTARAVHLTKMEMKDFTFGNPITTAGSSQVWEEKIHIEISLPHGLTAIVLAQKLANTLNIFDKTCAYDMCVHLMDSKHCKQCRA